MDEQKRIGRLHLASPCRDTMLRATMGGTLAATLLVSCGGVHCDADDASRRGVATPMAGGATAPAAGASAPCQLCRLPRQPWPPHAAGRWQL